MIITNQVAEANVVADTTIPAVVVVPAGVATNIVPDRIANYKGGQVVYCYIQNIGANPAYIAVGRTCDGLITVGGNSHVLIVAGQQLNTSEHRQRISCYSTLGTTFLVLQFVRVDNLG